MARRRRNYMAEIRRARKIIAYGQNISHMLSEERKAELDVALANVNAADKAVRGLQTARRGTVTLSDMDKVFATLDTIEEIYAEMKREAAQLQAALEGIENT